jgi:hypothetical protein
MNSNLKAEEKPEVAEAESLSEQSAQQVQNSLTLLEKRVDLEGSAQYSGALVRRRVIRTAMDLLRMLMVYCLTEYSLNMVGVWGTAKGWGSLCKSGVRKRLRGCQTWIGVLIVQVLIAGQLSLPRFAGTRVRVFDASSIHQPGERKAQWRLHLGFDLSLGRMDDVKLTSYKVGESLTHWQFTQGEIILADRIYGVARSLGVIFGALAYFVIRIGWQNLPVRDEAGRPFSLSDWLQVQSSDPSAPPAQVRVWVKTPQGRFPIRVVARAIPPEKAVRMRKNLQAEAKRQHRRLDERSLLAAGFVMVASNLPELTWSARQILELYRFRWQIELVFKRLKSLLLLDHLRVTTDPALAQTYLLTKILVALLLGELQWRLALAHPETFDDPDRPVSLWRLTQLLYETFRQAMIGSLTRDLIEKHWVQLHRYLRDEPRQRKSHFAHRPDLAILYGF